MVPETDRIAGSGTRADVAGSNRNRGDYVKAVSQLP